MRAIGLFWRTAGFAHARIHEDLGGSTMLGGHKIQQEHVAETLLERGGMLSVRMSWRVRCANQRGWAEWRDRTMLQIALLSDTNAMCTAQAGVGYWSTIAPGIFAFAYPLRRLMSTPKQRHTCARPRTMVRVSDERLRANIVLLHGHARTHVLAHLLILANEFVVMV